MSFRIISAAALLGAASFATAAAAADLPMYEPAPVAPMAAPAPVSWTALYLGVAVGGGSTNYEFDVDGPGFGANLDGISGEGWLADATIGFDYQIDRFVIGALADINWTDTEASAGFSAGDPLADGIDVDASIESKWGFDVLARAGVLLNERALLYALGGYSWRKFEASADATIYDDVNPDVTVSGSLDEELGGWTVGGGIEAMVTNNLSIKAEYRYTNFEDADYDLGGADLSVTPTEHTARIGVNYRFNGLFQ